MTNDKATRQAIIEGLKEAVDEFILDEVSTTADIEGIADVILSRLSELQPVKKTDELTMLTIQIETIIREQWTTISFHKIAEEIASILPRRETDKELLEALKNLIEKTVQMEDADAGDCPSNKDYEIEASVRQLLNKAIRDAELAIRNAETK